MYSQKNILRTFEVETTKYLNAFSLSPKIGRSYRRNSVYFVFVIVSNVLIKFYTEYCITGFKLCFKYLKGHLFPSSFHSGKTSPMLFERQVNYFDYFINSSPKWLKWFKNKIIVLDI